MNVVSIDAIRRAIGLCTLGVLISSQAASGQPGPVPPPASSGPPVTINSCGPILNKNQTTTVAGIPIPVSTSSGIAIEFVNDSTQTATLVNFAVHSAGDHFVIRDVGTFSPGVSIKHQFKNGQGQAFVLPAFISTHVTCHITSVKFADGSVWERGEPAAAQPVVARPSSSTPALSANPTRINLSSSAESQLFLISSSAKVAAFNETDNCGNIATILVAATGDASATYSVKPVAPGSCSARVTDEAGNAITVPIVIQ